MPKVSVIVPVYGVEKFIERCAKSLFAQTLDEIEFIFIDDCTPDNSMSILAQEIEKNRPFIAEKKWSVRTVRMPENSGQAAVRKHGILLATGQFLIHCDSDDWVEPRCLELLYNKAVDENLDVVFCDIYRSSDDVCEEWSNKCIDGQNKEYYFKKLLKRKCFSAVWNKLVKTDIYKKNDIVFPDCNMWEDFVLSVQAFYYAQRIGYVSQPLYNYYINQTSICFSNPIKKQEQVNVNSALILNFLKTKGLCKEYRNEICVLKNAAREELVPWISDTKYHRMWKRVYPEINIQYPFIRGISIKDRLIFILQFVGLFPLFVRKNSQDLFL